MQIKSIFTVLAAGLSLAMAMAMAEEDITTTSTQTMTKTLTITECNPTNTACPGYWSKTNSSVSAAPTWPSKNATSWAIPTGGKPTPVETVPVVIVPTPTPTKATTSTAVATAAAGGLFVQSSLMLGILGVGVALVA